MKATNNKRNSQKLNLRIQTASAVACRSHTGLPELSGEIFKEDFLDVFLTDSEQTAFSLIGSKNNNLFSSTRRSSQFSPRGENFYKRSSLLSSLSNPSSKKFVRDVSIDLKSEKDIDKKIRKTSDQIHNQNTIQKKVSKKNVFLSQTGIYIKVNKVKLGDYVYSGEIIGEDRGKKMIVGASGKVIRISKSQIILQKTQPVLYYSQAHVHVKNGAWVQRNAPILTLTHQTLVTGDIIQGIPRIEQLFEAPHSPPPELREKGHLYETLHSQLFEIFRQNWAKAALPAAVRLSLQQIQQILVESIQKVYLSQGVLIADKHIEIVVRQMTSKAEILDSGDSGLLMEELLPVQRIESVNLTTPGKKALYAPAVVGLTRSALESDSFISAASFQETTRVLSRDATTGKSDFLRGLKEKVVIGDLISAGTGLDVYFVYTLLSPGKSLSARRTKIEIEDDQSISQAKTKIYEPNFKLRPGRCKK